MNSASSDELYVNKRKISSNDKVYIVHTEMFFFTPVYYYIIIIFYLWCTKTNFVKSLVGCFTCLKTILSKWAENKLQVYLMLYIKNLVIFL